MQFYCSVCKINDFSGLLLQKNKLILIFRCPIDEKTYDRPLWIETNHHKVKNVIYKKKKTSQIIHVKSYAESNFVTLDKIWAIFYFTFTNQLEPY